MSFIGLVREEQATGELKALYDQVRQEFGFVPNFHQALGRQPGLLKVVGEMYASALSDGALSRKLKEQIGLVVSGINASSYCVAIHMEILHSLGVEKELGRTLTTNHANAPVSEKDKAIFRFADKLTRHPDEIGESDVKALRAVGWGEDAIFEAVIAASAFNLVNRISSGLGLVADF